MTSDLSPNGFFQTLVDKVERGPAWIKGSPLNVFRISRSRAKYFFGEYDNKKFKITWNAPWYWGSEFLIEGQFRGIENSDKSEVEVKLKVIPFIFIWVKIVPVLCLILLSALILMEGSGQQFLTIKVIWIWLGIPYLFGLWFFWKQKKYLIKRFCSEFEIRNGNN